jgi:hypothetical protein
MCPLFSYIAQNTALPQFNNWAQWYGVIGFGVPEMLGRYESTIRRSVYILSCITGVSRVPLERSEKPPVFSSNEIPEKKKRPRRP